MTQAYCRYFTALILFLSFLKAEAQQTCVGALGDPVINIDFDRGASNIGPSINETNYSYVAGNPNDGQYTIVKTSAGLNPGWHQNVINHTPNDPNGYFMLVNADLNKGIFYQTQITTQLCPNTTYEFAAYIINILRNSGVKPNIRFTITNNGLPIPGADFLTGDIPEGSATDWIKRGGTFITPANLGIIKLVMTNENPGGNGNDLAIDDITFRACGPIITSTVTNANNFNNNTANICVGDTRILILSAKASPGTYTSPQYQWQEFDGNNWVNSTKPGAQSPDLTVNFVNASLGNYKFQVLVAENGNINSTTCRVISSPITVNVNNKPNPTASNSGAACIGSNVQLNVDQGVSFSWTGPNGFSSTVQNPTLPNVSLSSAGTYIVTVFNVSGCSNTSQTQVQVLPPVIANTNITAGTICQNESVDLIASGGSSYSWLPIDGLSDPNIANPTASPKQTTTYTVSVSNGTCSVTKNITITVLKSASAYAGEDKKMLFGQSVTLNGNAIGDNITYLWSPSDYLEDPTKLNPVATPPVDMTYTLTVQSNCNVSMDNVFVKVYPKIEIPSAFTPNGDGINDTWNIPSIASFTNPKLKVVNRNGQLVFESTNTQSWDGKFNGKGLPTGVYYYTLYLNEGVKIYSGWVLLTR
ncbi:gliding motility-associated C-terminal domain-containing protein [Pedobacter polaris]|uniref:Gliding motility-associated C-terminal domain-containing protein n=1 Tax=Pedobacter polaris TaxID=2571273 RepID=A0A4U1CRV0_9SPHI|nr:gliding motility-associated C-terminal domain-containing protein [Pedobacter polaris]TKC08341.1 gliding motility-associated C-terminal domain-containing protein [Pedobacter polaris]